MGRDGKQGHKLSAYIKLNEEKDRTKKQTKAWKKHFKIKKGGSDG